jgi:hypothetical protein
LSEPAAKQLFLPARHRGDVAAITPTPGTMETVLRSWGEVTGLRRSKGAGGHGLGQDEAGLPALEAPFVTNCFRPAGWHAIISHV